MAEVAGRTAADTQSGPDGPVFPLPRTCPFAPPAEYRGLRADPAISRVPLVSGNTAWAIARHEDVRAMLTDRRFSSDRGYPNFPRLVPGQAPVPQSGAASLIGMDPPEHGQARRQVLGEFTVKRMKALQPRVQQIVDELIDTVLAEPAPADLVRALALPMPSLVICELLGVPYTDHEYFQLRSSRLLSRTLTGPQRRAAFGELQQYLSGLISDKEREPTDDLLGRQIAKRTEAGEYDHRELVSLAVLLLIAGHETSANMISLGIVALLEHPDQLAALVADPALTPAAVEELLRYFTIAEFATARVATEDLEFGGALIRAGEGVLGLTNAANRDPGEFPAPDELDLAREGGHHLAFGFGPHQCLGQNLARMELQIVFDTLFRRLPGLKLAAPVESLPFKENSNIYGLDELPVTW